MVRLSAHLVATIAIIITAAFVLVMFIGRRFGSKT